MFGKEITYKDLDDNPITETFWFHLSKAEIAEMALAKEGRAGGFDAYIRRLIESQDGESITQTFKEIILATVGRRSEDNKYFEKDDAYTRRFVQSDAYSVLFMELLQDPEKLAEFINKVVPKDMQEDANKATALANPSAPSLQGPQARVEAARVQTASQESELPKDGTPSWIKEGRAPTNDELRGATPEQIQEAFRLRSTNAGPVTQEPLSPQ